MKRITRNDSDGLSHVPKMKTKFYKKYRIYENELLFKSSFLILPFKKKNLLNTVPGTVLGIMDIAVNKPKIPILTELILTLTMQLRNHK